MPASVPTTTIPPSLMRIHRTSDAPSSTHARIGEPSFGSRTVTRISAPVPSSMPSATAMAREERAHDSIDASPAERRQVGAPDARSKHSRLPSRRRIATDEAVGSGTTEGLRSRRADTRSSGKSGSVDASSSADAGAGSVGVRDQRTWPSREMHVRVPCPPGVSSQTRMSGEVDSTVQSLAPTGARHATA